MNRILIVDDATVAAGSLKKVLAGCGFHVAWAPNGADGLEALERFSPHLVILDLDMPVLNGWGFLEAMRGRPCCDDVRVILYTSEYEAPRDVLQTLDVCRFCRKAHTSFATLLRDVTICMRGHPGSEIA